jgi:hypothetical protein
LRLRNIPKKFSLWSGCGELDVDGCGLSLVPLLQGLPKSGLMGFCDVALGEEKVLLVHYLFHNRPHTARIPDKVGSTITSLCHIHSLLGCTNISSGEGEHV